MKEVVEEDERNGSTNSDAFIEKAKDERKKVDIIKDPRIICSMGGRSAYMMRQAEKTQDIHLSPLEELKIARSELHAKLVLVDGVVKISDPDPPTEPRTSKCAVSTKCLIHAKNAARKLKGSSTGKNNVDKIDSMSPAEALLCVEDTQKLEDKVTHAHEFFDNVTLPWYVIHPQGLFRRRWDVSSITLILYNAFIIPIQLSYATAENNDVLHYIDYVVDMYFILDLFLNFVSAYENNGDIKYGKKEMAINYLTSWFIVDFISAFPFYLIFSNIGRDFKRLPTLTKVLRLFRLSRVFAFIRILNRLEYALLIRSTVSSIIKFIFLVLLSSHWLSCAFFFISKSEPTGWVNTLRLQNDGIFDQYVASIYWSIMTMTTVGYGDVSAKTPRERLFCLFAMVIGAWIFAYGITNVVAMITNLGDVENKFRIKMDKVNKYMEVRELPLELRGEIREFFYNARKSKETKLAKESLILSELSALLRSKIALSINDSVLTKMPFFHGADPNFIMELALGMSMVCFAPLEDVILEGEVGEEMFFIFRGAVEILKGGKQVHIIGESEYFALANHPQMKAKIKKIVRQRGGNNDVIPSLNSPAKSSAQGSILDSFSASVLEIAEMDKINTKHPSISSSCDDKSGDSFCESINTELLILLETQEKIALKVLALEKRIDNTLGLDS